MDINTIYLTGHLKGSAVLKQTDDGKTQALFWVMGNDQSEEDGSFFRVTLCSGAAEKLVPYLVNGKQVGICVQLLGAGNNEEEAKHDRP
jgi:single-stranded DNA-binding protein